VLTIAHEFGHAIHQSLSRRNKQIVCNPGLNISETASIFAEKLTNEYLLSKETDDKKKIELICSRLDDVMSTIFRQIAFFKFEQKIHEARADHELSHEELNTIWKETMTEHLGEGIEWDPCIYNYWGYITHFTNSPFYVYSYAFGALFVEGLYAVYKEKGAEFAKIYEEALASGGTKNFKEVAQMFGKDATSPEFWNAALNAIAQEVNDLEGLCDKAKVV
jgi:oligoendopeptidase F